MRSRSGGHIQIRPVSRPLCSSSCRYTETLWCTPGIAAYHRGAPRPGMVQKGGLAPAIGVCRGIGKPVRACRVCGGWVQALEMPSPVADRSRPAARISDRIGQPHRGCPADRQHGPEDEGRRRVEEQELGDVPVLPELIGPIDPQEALESLSPAQPGRGQAALREAEGCGSAAHGGG